jgi:hypothetical protein
MITCTESSTYFVGFTTKGGKHDNIPISEWEEPAFAKIKEKKTKRLSPYSETEIWERGDIFRLYLGGDSSITLAPLSDDED